jgi:uncharacterized protein YjbI with pentapeptide repeats
MTRLTRRDLERALAAARSPLSLNGADLLGVDLSGLDLGGADLAYAHLEDANLTGLICAGGAVRCQSLGGLYASNGFARRQPRCGRPHLQRSHADSPRRLGRYGNRSNGGVDRFP